MSIDAFDDLEAHGYPNPFLQDSLARWTRKRQTQGVFLKQVEEVSEEATSGSMEIKGKFALPHDRIIPPTGKMKKDLVDWYVRTDPDNTDTFYFECRGAHDRVFSTASIGKRPEVRAMLKALNDIREGSAVQVILDPTNLTQVVNSVTIRTFDLAQTAFSNVLFRVTAVVLDATTHDLILTCVQQTGSAFHAVGYLYNWLRDHAEVDIDVDEAEYFTPRTNSEAPTYGRRLHFDDDRNFLALRDRFPYFHGVDSQSQLHFDVPLGYGRVLDYSELFNSNNLRYLSLDYAVGTVHFGPDWGQDGSIWIRDPRLLIPLPGAETEILFHNNNATYDLTLRTGAADSTIFARLKPYEKLALRFTYDRRGRQEIINASTYIRALRMSATTLGNLADGNYLAYSSSKNARQIIVPDPVDYVNDDAFDINGADTWTDGEDWADQSAWHTAEAFKMKGAGRLRMGVDIGIRNNGTGNIPGGHTFDLWRQRGSALPVNKRAQLHSILGSNKEADWFYVWEEDVQENDVIFSTIRYSNSAGADMSNVELTSFALEAYLDQNIRIEIS